MYFTGGGSFSDQLLHVSDGTAAGTQALPFAARGIIYLTYFRGILVCSANTPDATRRELHLYNLANLLTPTVKPLSAIGFEIYPNPAPDFIIIRPAASRAHWAGTLFNQLGQKLAELTFTASTPLTIDLRRFPAGVYQLRVEDGREHYTANIVKP